MPRLVIKDAELLKILVKRYSFVIAGRRGSHIKLIDGKGHITTISIHNEEVKEGTLHAILEQTGLTKEDIVRYK